MSDIGNAWHIPGNRQPPGQASMRFPFEQIEADEAVLLSNGNQFTGSGNARNQTESGSAVMIRKAGETAWNPIPVQFQSVSGNDKFFFAAVAPNSFHAGDLVQYYFKLGYTDADTTFLHGTDRRSLTTADEAVAQADPFTFSVRFALQAVGPFLSFDSGPFQARIHEDSGHVALAGPVSASGTDATTGIVWATMPFSNDANMAVVPGVLRAFDASDVSKGELWDSEKSANDGLGFFAKYNPPVVANGKVFVAAFQQERMDNGHHLKAEGGLQPALVIYGLK